jgi:Flp pilus assembly protein TadD
VKSLKPAASPFFMSRRYLFLFIFAITVCLGPNVSLAAQLSAWQTSTIISSAAPERQTAKVASASEEDKEDAESKRAIAIALQQKSAGDQEGALTTLQMALIRRPHDLTLLKDIAVQALQMNRLKLADSAAREAHTLDPVDLDTLYALARIESEEDFFPASRKDFQIYLAARPADASAHYGFGHLLQRNQDVDGATAEFRRSIELQPMQTESYYQLGQMALDGHRDQEATKLFERTLTRAPQHGGALTGLGILAYRGHQYGQAEVLLERAVSTSPAYQPAHYYLGLVLNRLGQKEQSEQQLTLAKNLAEKRQGKSQPVPSER